nr:hypothetical protein [Micromonospora sp. DSM 115978]
MSSLFLGRRRYAEWAGLPWYLLSAKYGMLEPDDVVGPYDVYLADQPRDYRRAWGQFVAAQLARLRGDLFGLTVEVHAGAAYVEPLRGPFDALGVRLSVPLGHLRQGEQLAWYSELPPHGSQAVPASPTPTPAQDGDSRPTTAGDAAALVAALTDLARRRTPAEFLAADRRELNLPGLYTWWVDETGAIELTAGLGYVGVPGLVYAGQAGATRWPSGRVASNTLWSRIAGMHLAGRAEFSTFRRTLAAALREVLGLANDDDPQLSGWIGAHLKVVVEPVHDADELGRLEDEVLALLDPPLNLRGRPLTPLRSRL